MNTHNSNTSSQSPGVQWLHITSDEAGQRLDNYLITHLKGVPKTHIYKLIRTDEVRVNKKRVKADYRLQAEDIIRVAPVRMSEQKPPVVLHTSMIDKLNHAVLFEDEVLLVLNKPAGWAVHGGSGINVGIIEAVRQWRPYASKWELVHRLDKETSGCLVIAKKPSALKKLQADWDRFQKTYVALVCGRWSGKDKFVDAPLQKNILLSGERMVKVSADGKPSLSEFKVLQLWQQASLVQVKLHTGRTHQIRVHAQWKKHPLLGDEKYADEGCLKLSKQLAIKRLMLHAQQLSFFHPVSNVQIVVTSNVPDDMNKIIAALGDCS